MAHISVVAPFRFSISVFCCTESMRIPSSVPWLFPKGGRRTHCLKSTSPPISPYGSVAHTSHGNGGSAHTPLHDKQRYFHYIPRHPIYTSSRNESPARPHHRPTHHLRIGLPPHPAETSSSDLVGNSHTFHVLFFHAMRPYYIR